MFDRAHLTFTLGLGLWLGLGLGGCDSKATASDPAAIAPARKSKELESCAATSHCGDGLRCLDQLCQREARSTVGDFLAARGAKALAADDIAGAIKAYNQASAAYAAEQLAVPPDLDCGLGHALVAARAEKDKAELGARVLHRCLLAAPPGGRLRAQALHALTALDESGFDARQLARPELADLYLTAGPPQPDASALKVTITPAPVPRQRTWTAIAARLAQDDVKSALVACWEGAWEAKKVRELSAGVALTVKYLPSAYDDEPGRYTFAAEPAAGAAADGAADAACVSAAVLAPLSEIKGLRGEGFTTTLAVTVK